ncbi:MAG: hypothetical protein GY716_22255 [bacterium]|nr:hypothetical protein [bacterium]
MKAALPILVLLVLLAAACGNGEPVGVTRVTLARDDGNGEPGQPTLVFSPADRTFHAVIDLDHVAGALEARLIWIAVDAGGETNETIDVATFRGVEANVVKGRLTLPSDWPVGKYRLEIYLNGQLEETVDFTVESDRNNRDAGSAAPAAARPGRS